jgi:hypothetical protein
MAAVGGAAALLASARKERFRQQARAKALASRRDVLLSAGLQKRSLLEQFSDSDSGGDGPPLTGWAAMMKRVPSEERKAREEEERLARGEEDTVGSLRIMAHGPGVCFCLVLH